MLVKELLNLSETENLASDVKPGDKVVVDPTAWTTQSKSNGKATVIAVKHGEVHIRLDDTNEELIAFPGDYKVVKSADQEDAEAWHEKRQAALQGRHYHEPPSF